MIRTKQELKEICKKSLRMNVLTPQKMSITREMYKTATRWQMKDKYPPLIFFKERGSTYVMRVG